MARSTSLKTLKNVMKEAKNEFLIFGTALAKESLVLHKVVTSGYHKQF